MPIVRIAAASIVAALSVAAASSASAADLNGEYYGPRYGSAYDDPRYADIYRDPAPRRYQRGEDDYDIDDDAPPRVAEAPPPYGRHGGCLPRQEIHYRLRAEGWHEFQGLEFRRDIALVRARRPSGELYELRVDRCSGDIVHARSLRGPVWGPYAYGPPRRSWYRY